MDLPGKVAIVTGGAVRIGRTLSTALANSGVRVCIHYGASHEAAERTAAEIRAAGGETALVQADLADPVVAAETVVSHAVKTFGRADILINSAAIFQSGSLAATTAEDWDRHLRINLQAPTFLCRQFAAHFPEDAEGAIVNIVDWRAERPQPGHLAYTISKAGLVCLTKILALELAPRIRVNAVAPGAILPAPGASSGEFQQLAAHVPLGRTGRPSDIAVAVLYLLQSDFVTGEVLHVTGGQQLSVGSPGTPHI